MTPETIESLFRRSFAIAPDPFHSVDEQRFKAIGTSKEGRYLLVVFTIRWRGREPLIRPISARFMHRKEIETYEELFKA